MTKEQISRQPACVSKTVSRIK